MDLLDEARSTAIFRIFQETLTNILRHSEATEVDIQLRQEDSFIILQVKDNGRGIDPHKIEHSNSLGIIGMRERSQFLGGDISFKNVNGTLVTLKIPLNQQNVTADAEGET
ncbi:MAG: ATP-binding protein [Balneolaceae bacterium]